MTARLVTVGGGPERAYELADGSSIGRHPDNLIEVPDQMVSRVHCRITHEGGRWLLTDNGSLNGTYVNGRTVSVHALKPGDEVTVGSRIYRFEEDQPQSHAMGRVTMLFGSQAGVVQQRIDASNRFMQVDDLDLDTLRADYEKLRVAHELSKGLAVTTDLEQILQQIVDQTLQIIPAERAVILLVDAETGELVPNFVRQKFEDDEIKLSSSVLQEVRDSKQSVICFDASLDERFRQSRSIIAQGIRSTMCVPLLYDEELLGAMHMDSTVTSGAFTEKDLQLFTAIAQQAAVAIQNHRLAKKIEYEAATRAQFQRLLSPHLVDQLVTGALQLDQAGSEREVTMLFADIRGFTAMSERIPAEDMVRTLNDYFEIMVDVLFRHGGTLDKYVGDEIIGLFGAPVALDDAAFCAVECAQDMLRSLDQFNAERSARGVEPIEIGIGVNSGPVIAGAIGSSRTLQYTVIGDAVNVAARLCSKAKPGEILISQSTLAGCGTRIDVETRPPVQVKGKSEPLPIYSLRGSSAVHESTMTTGESRHTLSGHDEAFDEVTLLGRGIK